MSDTCRFERETIGAAKSGQWTEALREHAASCADCAAAASVAVWMDRIGRTDERQSKLPDPSVVWLKSQILRGSVAAERISRPVTIAQILAYVTVAAGWAGFLTWKWTFVSRWMSGFSAEHIAVRAASGGGVSLGILLTLFLLSSITVVVALHTILAED
jgi:hypothetical protein